MHPPIHKLLLALALPVLLFACPSSTGVDPTVYERLVIDTFHGPGWNWVDTYLDLFGSAGDPDADNPWTPGSESGQTIASNDNGNTDVGQTFMSRIDVAGLTAGTYYIRVRGNLEATEGTYAIRVLPLGALDSLPAYDYPSSEAGMPDAYEPDDDSNASWVMLTPVSIQPGNTNWRNRSIDYTSRGNVGDVDWFKLVLP